MNFNYIISWLSQWGTLLIATASLFISIFSLYQSKKAQDLQNKVNEVELQIKNAELENIRRKKSEKNKALIEARVYSPSKGKYLLKLWNSGEAKAFDITVEIEEDANVILFNEKFPFEELEPNKSFDESLIVAFSSKSKFYVTTKWKDKNNIEYSKRQLVTL